MRGNFVVKSFSTKGGYGFLDGESHGDIIIRAKLLPRLCPLLVPGWTVDVTVGAGPRGLRVEAIHKILPVAMEISDAGQDDA